MYILIGIDPLFQTPKKNTKHDIEMVNDSCSMLLTILILKLFGV